MKKIINLCFIFLFILLVTPNVFAKDNVFIESATLIDKSNSVSELTKPSVNDLNIGFDLSFVKLNDYAKYKIIVNNLTNNDYEISKDIIFDTSNYINYKYEFNNDTNIVKAKSKLTMYVVITYKNAVPSNKMVNGKYIENNNMAISLSNDNITNPMTGKNISILLGLILIIGISIIFIKNRKSMKFLSVLIIGLILIPLSTYAINKIKININTKVLIEEKYEVLYSFYNYINEDEIKDYSKAVSLKDLSSTGVDYYIVDGKTYSLYYVTISDGFYAPGDTVTVRDYKHILHNSCEDEESWIGSYPDDMICPSAILGKKTDVVGNGQDFWCYNVQNSNDLTIMNFAGDGDIHEYEGQLCTKKPKTFTMPSHDVELFNETMGIS